MTLLEVAAKRFSDKTAIVSDEGSKRYEELLEESNRLALHMYHHLHIENGKKVAILCRNHIPLIEFIFAVSRTGADIKLLNTEMGKEQLRELLDTNEYDAIIYDKEFAPVIEQLTFSGVKVVTEDNDVNNQIYTRIPRTSSGKLILQTGGTTGKPKEAGHKPSLFNYLNPFIAFINRLNLLNYHTAYIGTPIFHGYGMAVLLLFIALGKTCVITRSFEVEKACHVIEQNQVEVVSVVPTMLDRMLKHNVNSLRTLKCIASGGAKLSPTLVQETFQHLGDVLYNLYGTSEAGLMVIATPDDLHYSPFTLGKKITGVQLNIMDGDKQKSPIGNLGEFYVKTSWSMQNRNNSWMKTGDMGYRDELGYFYLSGRSDEMVVSGGENVFPADIERVLLIHPHIFDAAVVGEEDEEFGERLVAYVVTDSLHEEEILTWLKPRVARYQMPKDIHIIKEIPYSSVGKQDKKKLTSEAVRYDT
jgi:fatty-acyl-CoA synthase